MPRLLINTPGKEPLVYEIVKPRITIGRSERNDLVLNDLNASRLHAVLEQTPEGYRIIDQNSRNGMFIGNQPCREAVLENGSTVRLGDSVLRFEDSTAAWNSTTMVERSVGRADLLATAVGERDLAEATEALKRLSMAVPAARSLPEMQKQLREAERRALLFEVVTKARRSFQDVTSPDQVLETIPKLVFSVMKADRVLVMLWDEEKQCLRPADIHERQGGTGQGNDLALSQTLLNSVLRSRKGVLIRDARLDPELLMRESVMLSGLRSAICAPMAVEQRLYGLVYADNCRLPLVFDEDELELLSILSQEGALALHAARTREEQLRQERTREAYRRFLPEHLAELLISQPDAVKLGGARQHVTALFSDLRGFTSLAEQLQPEDAVALLNSFFSEMTSVVFRHGGTLDKYLGDGLLAVFGAPLSSPTDALRAVQCAAAMQATLDELALEWRSQGRPVIPMGIGVNSGEAIVGTVGSSLHMEYTIIGDPVNVAARLTQHAGPGEILLGEATWREVQGQVQAEPLPPLQLKGKREPATVYRLLRTGALTDQAVTR